MNLKKVMLSLACVFTFAFAANAQVKMISVGETAPEFSYVQADSKTKLGPQDFKGKYLLLDFWASWCPPCRKSIPHLKEIYKQYKDKNFEILAVSVDQSEADWKRALQQEAMPWPQVHAAGDLQNIATIYQFTGIPHMVLIGPDGNVIARGLQHQEVEELLKEKLK